MTNVEPLLKEFEFYLEETINEVWSAEKADNYLDSLSQQPAHLLAAAAKVADICSKDLALSGNGRRINEAIVHYIINFTWADRLKSFFILWRDILFEQQKAAILHGENKVDKETVLQLKDRSKEVVLNATTDLKNLLPSELKSIKRSKNGVEKHISHWKHQENPWPVYKKQISQVVEQCLLLADLFGQLKSIEAKFGRVQRIIENELQWCKAKFAEIKEKTNSCHVFIENNLESKPANLLPYLEELEDKTAIRHHQNEFTESYEQQLEALANKLQVPVQTQGGLLRFREINFNRRTRQWLESEILPLFYEIWELTDSLIYGKKMTIVNVRNRVLLANKEKQESSLPPLEVSEACQPLQVFLKKAETWENSLSELRQTVKWRLEKDFNVSNVYDLKNEYLPIPIEYTINQFGIDKIGLIATTKKWADRLTGKFQQFRDNVEREEILSTPEKVVRYIQAKKGNDGNSHYASIFLTKGYLGESFWIGRENEIRHMQGIIAQWQQGFRGAAILSGRRFCGKSLFGELIANRFFYDKTIRLVPNSTLSLSGRKMETGHDLGKVLGFVSKYSLNESPLVWIDDLELWKGDQVSLQKNVRSLKEFVDNHSNRMFFIVAMSSWVKSYLDRLYGISKAFQTEIHLDRMSQKEVHQAILIRHGATHKTLIDENGQEVSPQQFGKFVARAFGKASGNIGDALNQWAFSTQKFDEEKVVFQEQPSYLLPDFLNADYAVALAAITMEKNTTEYRLRKAFGPAFAHKYSPIIKRLLHMGILSRQLDGSLEIEEVAANDVARLLLRKKFIA